MVRWSDVEVDENNDTIKTRKAMESGVRLAALVLGSSRLARAWANHLRNIASVSIISVKPAWLIFTVETIDGGPGWVWP